MCALCSAEQRARDAEQRVKDVEQRATDAEQRALAAEGQAEAEATRLADMQVGLCTDTDD